MSVRLGVGGGPALDARPTRAARHVASQARLVTPALVNGTAGAVITVRGRPIAILDFTVVDGRIVAINGIADPERVRRVAPAVLDGEPSPSASA
jgi:hypothetical protein